MSNSNLAANKQLARRWYEEVWNQKSEAAIDALFSLRGTAHGFPAADSELVGPEAFKVIHRNFCGAFPDLRVTIHDLVAEDDKVAIRWSATMTHTGDYLHIPVAGKKATLHGSSFITIQNNQIVDGWNHMDIEHFYQKLR